MGCSVRYSARATGRLSLSKGERYSEKVRRVAAKPLTLVLSPYKRRGEISQSAALIDVEGSRARLV